MEKVTVIYIVFLVIVKSIINDMRLITEDSISQRLGIKWIRMKSESSVDTIFDGETSTVSSAINKTGNIGFVRKVIDKIKNLFISGK